MHFLFGQNRPMGSSGQTPRGEAACVRNTAGCRPVLLAFSIRRCLAFLGEPAPNFPEVMLAWKCLGEEHELPAPHQRSPPSGPPDFRQPSHCRGCCKTTRF